MEVVVEIREEDRVELPRQNRHRGNAPFAFQAAANPAMILAFPTKGTTTKITTRRVKRKRKRPTRMLMRKSQWIKRKNTGTIHAMNKSGS